MVRITGVLGRLRIFALLLCSCTMLASGDPSYAADSLEEWLASRPIDDLAKRARILGDSSKGAVIFHRPGLSCVQCHSVGRPASQQPAGDMRLGPDLADLDQRATYLHVVESILQPSRVVRQGYQSETLLLATGKAITGLVRAEADKQLVVVVPGEERPRTIDLADVEQRMAAPSMMPAGLINQLKDEAEFFDLVSFVVAIGKAGPNGAGSLLSPDALPAPPPLPEYEHDLDHHGLIDDWDEESLADGESLYNRLCINCHGTQSQPGSLPNALRFATDKFRNGADPWSMYKTITHGYRMMLPQRQLTPREKYNVIHYIREVYLKPHNSSQFVSLSADYLANLPEGSKHGPEPVEHRPWRDMDYGPFLINTYEIVGPDTLPRPTISRAEQALARRENRPPQEKWPVNTNFAYKGIAIRLDPGSGGVAAGTHWLAFDHDTMRVAGAWSGEEFIDWEAILFNGRHAIAPRTIGKQHFANPPGPGWAHPLTGSFEDPRLRGRDGNFYGPLPRKWAHYRGLYKHGDRVVISYTVGDAPVLEAHRLETRPDSTGEKNPAVWVRTLNVGRTNHDLTLRVAAENSAKVAVVGREDLQLSALDGYTLLHIPAAATPVNLEIHIASRDTPRAAIDDRPFPPEDLRPLTQGGPAAWPRTLPTIPQIGSDDGPLVIDTLVRPESNPWKSRMRCSGLDFMPDEKRLVVCCSDGDVWIVDGIDRLGESIAWRRIASGLFQPLGVKVIDGKIFVGCRDQIVILNDLNGDGETDFYENFNNDHQVTDHFHEFAMGLQSDADGNVFYAKSARHARDSLVPQHGTLLRVSADGKDTRILANGFRAANGVCLNPDGSFYVTDQEGHWTPMNRINRVVNDGFYGNIYSYNAPADTSDEAMSQPICWVDKGMDRSPAELVWVDSPNWGPLQGSLLSLSYGVGEIFLVPHEQVDGQWQGGLCRLPLDEFPTGIIRARFHPGNGQMYVCGMQAWATNQTEATGGLYRVRYTGRPLHMPVKVSARTNGIELTFTEPIDQTFASDVKNYMLDVWSLRRTANYGSDRYDEQSLEVASASVSSDGRSVMLKIPQIGPTQCMQIAYTLKDDRGFAFKGVIQNTIHRLR